MKSSLLCVVGIRLLCLVIATRDPLASALIDIECAGLFFLQPKNIMLVKRGVWPEDDDNLKEWVHCVLVKNEVMTKNGDLRLKNLLDLEHLPQAEAERKHLIIYNCLPTDYYVSPKEISWQFAQCFQKEDPENSIF